MLLGLPLPAHFLVRTLIHTYSTHATCSGTEGVSLTLCSLHRPFSLFESAIVDMHNMRSEDQDLQEGLRRSLQESKQAITWRNDGTLARFQERLNLLGFTHTDVDGDGHCLFATMAQCLRNTEQGSMPMEDQPMHTWQSLRIQLSEDLRHSDNFKELLSMVPVQRFWVQYISLCADTARICGSPPPSNANTLRKFRKSNFRNLLSVRKILFRRKLFSFFDHVIWRECVVEEEEPRHAKASSTRGRDRRATGSLPRASGCFSHSEKRAREWILNPRRMEGTPAHCYRAHERSRLNTTVSW